MTVAKLLTAEAKDEQEQKKRDHPHAAAVARGRKLFYLY